MSVRQRAGEISSLSDLSDAEVVRRAGKRLRVFDDCEGIHRQLADEIAGVIERRNKMDGKSRFILPVGPVGQYPLLLQQITERRISLKNCWFFFMDEYADTSGRCVPVDHPLSFQRQMREMWLNHIDEDLKLPESQIFFPDESNISMLAEKIDEAGGIDLCVGGVGINGHVAFNEPEPGVLGTGPRKVTLSNHTITINAIRSRVGGNIEGFPREAFTLGMRQIMGARQIRLVCRNGINLDWANTVLRLTLLGYPGDDYPCTYIKTHPEHIIYTDKETLRQPGNLI
ncbi:MAG: 6-phosphogluconolactonase [Victivallales bacterium]|nr:6-phosphogluconolactonase [Victivallales bacterium]